MLPALLLGLCVTGSLCAAELMPTGREMVAIRVAHESALRMAAASGADLVSLPAPGFAVLYGDARRIRAVAGVAWHWTGHAPCSPGPSGTAG